MTTALGCPCQRPQPTLEPPAQLSAALTRGPEPEQPLGGPLAPQLYDWLPWAFHRLPGPHQKIFRYQEVVRDYICQEINRHKLRAPKAPKDFISCYLAQITKVGLKWLQRERGGCLPVMYLVSRPCLSSSSLTLSTSFQSPLKQQPFRIFSSIFSQARAGFCRHG